MFILECLFSESELLLPHLTGLSSLINRTDLAKDLLKEPQGDSGIQITFDRVAHLFQSTIGVTIWLCLGTAVLERTAFWSH